MEGLIGRGVYTMGKLKHLDVLLVICFWAIRVILSLCGLFVLVLLHFHIMRPSGCIVCLLTLTHCVYICCGALEVLVIFLNYLSNKSKCV